MLVCDSLGRMSGGIVLPTNHANYEIWTDPNDIRHSVHNFKSRFWMNKPDSEYFGMEIILTKKEDGKMYITLPDGSVTNSVVDTTRNFYPYFHKIEGLMPWRNMEGQTMNDRYIDSLR